VVKALAARVPAALRRLSERRESLHRALAS